MYAMLAKVDKAKIQAVKEYIVNANDKDLAQLFTEHFAEAIHLSMLSQNDDVKAQSAGIKMFHIAMTMGYVKRNVLYESASKSATSQTIPLVQKKHPPVLPPQIQCKAVRSARPRKFPF